MRPFLLSELSSVRAAVIMILEPVWTAIIAVFWFSERMSWMQMAGCSLILLALLVNRWDDLKKWLH